MKLGSLLRRPNMVDARTIGRQLVRDADAARDRSDFAQASALYKAAIELLPSRGDLHVQLGNMLKEIGDFTGAERAYYAAEARMPEDADVALQLGHLFKSAGRLAKAEASFGRALALKPNHEAASRELAQFGQARRRLDTQSDPLKDPTTLLMAEISTAGVTRALLPRPFSELMQDHANGIEWRRLGRRERTHWDVSPVLRGVEALRGFCIAEQPILMIEFSLNGLLIYRGPMIGGYTLPLESTNLNKRKYIFNVWIDLSGFTYGKYRLEVRAVDTERKVYTRIDDVVIAPGVSPSLAPESDGIVDPESPDDPRPLDEQINTRPSMIRPAGRSLLGGVPRAVLVQRADQLGDFIVSIPAIRRLRELFPNSQLIGLVSSANRELAETLALFDVLVTVSFPAREVERRRVMPVEAQKRLAEELAGFPIDLAIDLSEAESSRLLLPLSGAPMLVGFRSGQFPGLDVDFSANTYDKANDHEIAPHSRKALGLVEWLAVLINSAPNLVVRADLDRNRLSRLSIPLDADYIVLHAGARAAFSRWPHYLELAELLVQEEGLHVVMLTSDAADEARVSDALRRSGHFKLIHGQLEFDDFDTLISLCSVFVGDDSGPKHLASLRGAKVVSVQTARNNWIEWGQDSTGLVVTRKVPCAGCLIQTDLEAQECGREIVCLTAIRPSEVFSAVMRLLPGTAKQLPTSR